MGPVQVLQEILVWVAAPEPFADIDLPADPGTAFFIPALFESFHCLVDFNPVFLIVGKIRVQFLANPEMENRRPEIPEHEPAR